MLERDLQITHPLGLHAQASAKVVQVLTGFRSQAFLLAKGREVNAKSIMGVMLLAAGPGTRCAPASKATTRPRRWRRWWPCSKPGSELGDTVGSGLAAIMSPRLKPLPHLPE